MSGRRRLAAAAAVALLALLLGASQATAARVPRSFFGVSPQGALTSTDFARMKGVVGTVRVPVYWFEVEARQGELDFGPLDALVGEAADAGIRVLPFVYGSPRWLTGDPAKPPLSETGLAAWTRFLRALVGRYGPRGDFWRGRPRRMPIRRWQLWNEPNFPVFWKPSPSPLAYARLLAAGARAVRGLDPRARIVLAGLAPIEREPLPWEFLEALYAIPGAKRNFDAVGLHPYSSSVLTLEYQLRETRAVMAAAGDRSTPIEVTEFGVASDAGRPTPLDKGAAGQAAFLRAAFKLLVRHRRGWRISGADWFTWRDGAVEDPNCVFCQHSGLFDLSGSPKPAWSAYRAVVSRYRQRARVR